MDLQVPSEYILQVRGLRKSYGGIKALDHIFFDLKKGEVHALMGENGAGKSTFMKILAGLEKPDTGEILFDSRPFSPKNSRDALLSGISMIHQELLTVPELTVADNLFLGKEVTRYRHQWIDKRAIYRKATYWLEKLGVSVAPQTKIKELSLAEMQLVEIAKALSNNARVLIMDEPTSALSDKETEKLFEIIQELKGKGVSIIYISHKMDEIFRISDTITVFRDGRLIDSRPSKELDQASLISMMVGRSLNDFFPEATSEKGGPIYTVHGLCKKGVFSDISFELHAGEIIGVAGLVGAGRTELARVLYGLDRADSGQVWLHNEPMLPSSPEIAIKKGIGYVSEDRKNIGLVTGLSILENVSLASLKEYTWYGLIDGAAEYEAASKIARHLRIKCHGLNQLVSTLSGGNQQKVALAKTLLAKPKVVILDEPTRGIDIGAKVEIYHLIRQLASEGLGVLLISSELPEIIGLSDRVLVLAKGTQTALLTRAEATQEKVMYYAVPR